MSILNKYHLKLLGNIIVDDIYHLPKWAEEGTSNTFQSHRTSVGGIGNIIQATTYDTRLFVEAVIGNDNDGQVIENFLQQRNINNTLHISNKPTSKALILSNLVSKERTSFVNWGCGEELFTPSDNNSFWSHISYLDVIPSLDVKSVRHNSSIVSADVCLSNPSTKTVEILLTQLQYLDYLFISEAELPALTQNCSMLDLVHQYQLKCLVFHTRQSTTIIKKDLFTEVVGTHNIVENVDVLGAGDAYCANFILYLMDYKADEVRAARWAHQQATQFIVARKT